MRLLALLILTLVLAAPAAAQRQVVVNGEPLDAATLSAFEQQYNVRIQDGRYWYDARSGAWGFHGGPTIGYIVPGLDLGGALQADASGGQSGVFINGRALHQQEILILWQLLGAVYPGRYWMDAAGNVGQEGGPVLLNLFDIARQAQANRFYRSDITDHGYGASGDTFYVMGKDWSVTVTN